MRAGGLSLAAKRAVTHTHRPRKHAHAAVLQLGLAHPLDVVGRGEAERVKVDIAHHALEVLRGGGRRARARSGSARERLGANRASCACTAGPQAERAPPAPPSWASTCSAPSAVRRRETRRPPSAARGRSARAGTGRGRAWPRRSAGVEGVSDDSGELPPRAERGLWDSTTDWRGWLFSRQIKDGSSLLPSLPWVVCFLSLPTGADPYGWWRRAVLPSLFCLLRFLCFFRGRACVRVVVICLSSTHTALAVSVQSEPD